MPQENNLVGPYLLTVAKPAEKRTTASAPRSHRTTRGRFGPPAAVGTVKNLV
jgi:hypothetical protein